MSAERMVASLPRQIIAQDRALHESALNTITADTKQGREWQIRDLEKVFSLVCEDDENLFLVIDASDECDESKHRKATLGFLTGLEQEGK